MRALALLCVLLAFVACARSGVGVDEPPPGTGGAGGAVSDGGAGGAPVNEAHPCVFHGSSKIAQCGDMLPVMIPFCGYEVPAPFDDCIVSEGDDTGLEQGWNWYCCPASHVLTPLDGGAQ